MIMQCVNTMQEKRPSAIQCVNIDDGNGRQLDFVVNYVRCQSREILKLESLNFLKLVKVSNHALNTYMHIKHLNSAALWTLTLH